MVPPLGGAGSVEEQAGVASGGGPRVVGYAPEPERPHAITLAPGPDRVQSRGAGGLR